MKKIFLPIIIFLMVFFCGNIVTAEEINEDSNDILTALKEATKKRG